VSFSLDVPDIGTVEFSGSYGPGGQWSLGATYPGPVTVGPLVLTDMGFVLSNTSLTLSATGSVADLQAFVNAEVTAQIFYDGQFQATVDAHVLQLGGFSLGQAVVTFGNVNPSHEFILTVNAVAGIPDGPNVNLSGYIDQTGNYDFTGTQNIGLAGLTLSSAAFELSKANGFTFSAEWNYVLFMEQVSGTIGSDGHVHFEGKASMGLAGFNLGTVDAVVDLDPPANSYSIHFTAETAADFFVASVNLDGYAYMSNGQWQLPTLTAQANVGGPLSSILSGSATFTIDSNQVTFDGMLGIVNVPGLSVEVGGTVYADGSVQVSGIPSANPIAILENLPGSWRPRCTTTSCTIWARSPMYCRLSAMPQGRWLVRCTKMSARTSASSPTLCMELTRTWGT
jgi:hypothetical protein